MVLGWKSKTIKPGVGYPGEGDLTLDDFFWINGTAAKRDLNRTGSEVRRFQKKVNRQKSVMPGGEGLTDFLIF